MPKYIIKLQDKTQEWYLEWSSIVDAPTTQGMALDSFKNYYLETYGQKLYEELPERLARVEKTGTSALDYDLEQIIRYNRAGCDESSLTMEKLIDTYCRKETK